MNRNVIVILLKIESWRAIAIAVGIYPSQAENHF